VNEKCLYFSPNIITWHRQPNSHYTHQIHAPLLIDCSKDEIMNSFSLRAFCVVGYNALPLLGHLRACNTASLQGASYLMHRQVMKFSIQPAKKINSKKKIKFSEWFKNIKGVL
jgi:hypothetical protein